MAELRPSILRFPSILGLKKLRKFLDGRKNAVSVKLSVKAVAEQ